MFRIKILLLLFLLSNQAFCKKIKEGTYRGVLIVDSIKNIEIPFNFDVQYKGKKPTIIIRNADERIFVDEITLKGDSVNFKMPVFDTEFKCVIVKNGLEGVWINHYKTENNLMKFKAVYNESRRFLFDEKNTDPYFEGKWETTFSPASKDSSKAIAVFHHVEQTNFVTGTFLTETGDYRYLEGIKSGNKLFLSGFDGMHAFLFIAEKQTNNTLIGVFYSGASWKESWVAKRNETFKLHDAEEITFIKNKDETLNFSFPDLEKNQVALSDQKYKNKVVIIQVMGSWCPNCMDESRYLTSIYSKYKQQGLEIIALAFEKTTDFEKAKTQVQRMKNRLGINYDILITQQSGAAKASEVLSAFNKISAFPTTIFLNKQHQVVKVHTGFSGPATGQEYEVYKTQTENSIEKLLRE